MFTRKFARRMAAPFVAACLLLPGAVFAQEIGLFYPHDVPQAAFGAAEIQAAGAAKGRTVTAAGLADLTSARQPVRIVMTTSTEETRLTQSPLASGPAPESYAISKKVEGPATTWFVAGDDPAGAMYGALDVAEAIRIGNLDDLAVGAHTPFIAHRGIKFNIPLDARTPSYSDVGDAAQQNIGEMWSMDFWKEFLDEMARDRYDVLSLWNLQPFPSLVRTPGYPNVALNDVMRTTEKYDSTFDLSAKDMLRPSMWDHLEVVKKMSMDDKIKFWRAVMQYAHDRGIDVYLFTWNIFDYGIHGQYGITSAQTNRAMLDYYRQSVAETLKTYPLLKGLGITAGENMQNVRGEFGTEKWLWKAYGEAVRDVKKTEPDRQIPLIHRTHLVSMTEIQREWTNYPDLFAISFKYSVAHMYSETNPPFAKQTVDALPPGMKTWLTVRNDDIYSFRWGDPEFVRGYLRCLPPPDKLAGFYMGPDGYVWGREIVSTEPDTPRQLMIKKQGYTFLLWGRLAYDPALPDSLFVKRFAAEFPRTDADTLFAAYAAASKIIPQINRFFWAKDGNDFGWFPEGCIHHPGGTNGFYTVTDFMRGKTMPGSGILDIAAYANQFTRGQTLSGRTPPEVAAALQADAARALALTARLGQPQEKELRFTIGDLNAMAHLGNYYSDKISAATELALFQKTGATERRASAVTFLEKALAEWKQYAAIATAQYRPQELGRIGYFNLNDLTACAQRDITIAQQMTAP